MSQLVKAIEIYIAKTFSGKQKDNQLFQARKRLFVYEGNKEETPFISLYKYIAELQQDVADLQERIDEDEELYFKIENDKFEYFKHIEKKYTKLMKELGRPLE